MRAYMESGFYVVYLILMIGIGCSILLDPVKRKNSALFGAACAVLGFGDAFHLIPRAVGLFNGTLDAPGAVLAAWLGVGKLVTSITMTAFYILLYYFLYRRSGREHSRWIDVLAWVCTTVRVVLCAFPQNGWLTNDSPLSWGVARNIPFVILGVIVIVSAYRTVRDRRHFRLLWLAIILSFGFYLPVVLWASTHSWVGMLMLPKTICYGWIALMGLFDIREAAREARHG